MSATAAPVPARLAGEARPLLHDPVFISDLHLCADRPATLARFQALLAEIAGHAAELVILGDLFEYWAGDDTLAADGADDLVGQEVARALLALSARNVSTYVLHGNRDLLLGSGFLAASGAQLLAEPSVAHVAGIPTLLAHGDAYCTRDLPYMAFRRQARDANFQQAFLTRPLAERRAMIGQARVQSEAGKREKAAGGAMDIMDVTDDAIAQALREAQVRTMIHGHTHRPARHDFELDGAPAVRWVLPDWELDGADRRGGGLRVSGGTLVAFDV